MIKIIEYSVYSEFATKLQQEVFEFGTNSALNSGLFDTLTESQQFTREIITDSFKSNPDKQYCFAIYSDNNMVGCAWLRDYRSSESPSEIRLSYIRINTAYQRKGISAQAISLLEEYFIKSGFTEISLNVFASIPHAKKLYERIGFRPIHETKRDNKVVTTEMRKNINLKF